MDATLGVLRPRVALLVGNGIALDFRLHSGATLRDWDPSQPLTWHLTVPNASGISRLEGLPRLADALQDISLQRESSDFGKLGALARAFEQVRAREHASRTSADAEESSYLEFQVRYFLAVAYSQFQAVADRVDIGGWHWTDWLSSMRGHIAGVISLNYDILVESACETAGLLPYKLQTSALQHASAIPVFKPHGSIDFDIADGILYIPFDFPVGNIAINGCDYPIKQRSRDTLLTWRQTSDIVLPHEYSPLSKVQWVRPWYPRVRDILSQCDYLVIVGISYSRFDQPEIDYLIESMPVEARVIIANPEPPEELLRALGSAGRPWTNWPAGPEGALH